MLRRARLLVPPPAVVTIVAVTMWLITPTWENLYKTGERLQENRDILTETTRPVVYVQFPKNDNNNTDAVFLRPLFDETRRPFQRPAPQETTEEKEPRQEEPVEIKPPPEPPVVELLGVLHQGTSAVALVRTETGVERWLRTGETLEGWKIATIGSNFLTLTASEIDITIRIAR